MQSLLSQLPFTMCLVSKVTPKEPLMLVEITSKHQVTFPARVLDALGVGPGDRLALEEGPDGLLDYPSGLALDVAGGKRYWVDRNGQERASQPRRVPSRRLLPLPIGHPTAPILARAFGKRAFHSRTSQTEVILAQK